MLGTHAGKGSNAIRRCFAQSEYDIIMALSQHEGVTMTLSILEHTCLESHIPAGGTAKIHCWSSSHCRQSLEDQVTAMTSTPILDLCAPFSGLWLVTGYTIELGEPHQHVRDETWQFGRPTSVM